jgi:hypothetical protein
MSDMHLSPYVEYEAKRLGIIPEVTEPAPNPLEPVPITELTLPFILVGLIAFCLWYAAIYVAFALL